jgi:hypothetical protein
LAFVFALSIYACARKHMQAQPDQAANSEQSNPMVVPVNSSVPLSCGELLKEFSSTLNNSQSCSAASECKYFASAPTGCWVLYNQSAQDKLNELLTQLHKPRCRLFYPMFKCASQPGEANCLNGKCTFSTAAPTAESK